LLTCCSVKRFKTNLARDVITSLRAYTAVDIVSRSTPEILLRSLNEGNLQRAFSAWWSVLVRQHLNHIFRMCDWEIELALQDDEVTFQRSKIQNSE
jgi:hypothetical protein